MQTGCGGIPCLEGWLPALQTHPQVKHTSPGAGRANEFKNWTDSLFPCPSWSQRGFFFVLCDLSPHYSSDVKQMKNPTKFGWDTNMVRMMSKLCASELSPLWFSCLKEGLWQQPCCSRTVQQFHVSSYRRQIRSDLARGGAGLQLTAEPPVPLPQGCCSAKVMWSQACVGQNQSTAIKTTETHGRSPNPQNTYATSGAQKS